MCDFSTCNIIIMFCSHSNSGFMHTELNNYIGREMNIYITRHLISDITDISSQVHYDFHTLFTTASLPIWMNQIFLVGNYFSLSHSQCLELLWRHKFCCIYEMFPESLKEKGNPPLNMGHWIP